jgi:hypothetical protein
MTSMRANIVGPPEGFAAAQAAGRLGKQAWIKERGETDFNRPLRYGPL